MLSDYRLKPAIPTLILALAICGPQSAALASDGCTLAILPDFYGKSVVQEILNVAFLDACGRHDSCYRNCFGPLAVGFPAHKEACDGAFLLEMSGWCGLATVAEVIADAGLDPGVFLTACEGAMITAYLVLQGSVGWNAYKSDQCPACDGPFNPLANGACCYFNDPRCNRCSSTPEDRQLCRDSGGVWNSSTCTCDENPSPVLLDLKGNGFSLTGADQGVDFDFDGDGHTERTSWTSPGADDAFLVMDRNHNGRIDNGSELFGDQTSQPLCGEAHGFRALAIFDHPGLGGNEDGKISIADRAYRDLRLWTDANHDGLTQREELTTLADWDILWIDLDYRESRRRDAFGNEFRFRCKFQQGHRQRFAYDVFFVLTNP